MVNNNKKDIKTGVMSFLFYGFRTKRAVTLTRN